MDKSKEAEFSDTKSLVSKRSLWKTKIVVSGVVAVVLLLSAMVSMAVYSVFAVETEASSFGRNQFEGGRNANLSSRPTHTAARERCATG